MPGSLHAVNENATKSKDPVMHTIKLAPQCSTPVLLSMHAERKMKKTQQRRNDGRRRRGETIKKNNKKKLNKIKVKKY